MRALSSAVNDPATACMCVNELGRLLAQLAGRAMPEKYRFADGDLRVITPVPEFGRMVDDSLIPVIRQSGGNLQVLSHVLDALGAIHDAAPPGEHASALRACVLELHAELAAVRPRRRSAGLRRRMKGLDRVPGRQNPL